MRETSFYLLLAACLTGAPAHAASAPIEDYGKLPAVEQMQLSPSGSLLAYIQLEGEDRKLVVRKVDGPVVRVVDAGKLKVCRVSWRGEDHVLMTTQKPETILSADRPTILNFDHSLALNVPLGTVAIIFAGDRGMTQATFGDYGMSEVGGKTYGYFGGVVLVGAGGGIVGFDNEDHHLTHSHPDLFKVDLDTGAHTKIFGGSELFSSDWVVNPAGEVVSHAEYSNRLGEWRLYSGSGSGELVDRVQDPTHQTGVIGQGRSPGSLLVAETGEAGDWGRFEYSRAGHRSEPFPDTSVREELYDDATGLLMGAVTNGDTPKTILLDPVLQAKFDKVIKAFPGETAYLVSGTANLDRMIIYTEGPGDSGTDFFVDYPAHKIVATGWAYPTILQDAVAATQVVPYKAADGLEMQGILTLPNGRSAKNLALIVMPHGGPEARDYQGFDYWAQAFASRGYAVFQPNFRGSDGFGKAFRDAGFGQWGRKMQTDISDGVSELARQGIVDPKRACIVGASYGGYAALAGVTLQHGLYRCAVSLAGVADVREFRAWAEGFDTRNATTRYLDDYLGMKGRTDPALKAISPFDQARQADAPILLLHGKDDSTVPIQQSYYMRDALKAAGKSVEFVELLNEDHNLSHSGTRTLLITSSIAFVEKFNPPN